MNGAVFAPVVIPKPARAPQANPERLKVVFAFDTGGTFPATPYAVLIQGSPGLDLVDTTGPRPASAWPDKAKPPVLPVRFT